MRQTPVSEAQLAANRGWQERMADHWSIAWKVAWAWWIVGLVFIPLLSIGIVMLLAALGVATASGYHG